MWACNILGLDQHFTYLSCELRCWHIGLPKGAGLFGTFSEGWMVRVNLALSPSSSLLLPLTTPHPPTPYLLTLQIANPQPWSCTLFSERPSWLFWPVSQLRWSRCVSPPTVWVISEEASTHTPGASPDLQPALLKSPWGLLEQSPPSPTTYPISPVC